MFKYIQSLIICLLLLIAPTYAIDEKTPEKQQSMLYPTVSCRYGSGVIIKSWSEEQKLSDGTIKTRNFAYAITAYHVYEHYKDVTESSKRLPFKWFEYDDLGNPTKSITTLGHLEVADEKLDFAIFKIQTGKTLRQAAKLNICNRVALFDKIYVTGYPLGMLTIGQGRVSSLTDSFFCHSSHIFYGNSGGPAFNSNYELIGVNVQIEVAGNLPLPFIGKATPLWQIALFLEEDKVKEYFGVKMKSEVEL